MAKVTERACARGRARPERVPPTLWSPMYYRGGSSEASQLSGPYPWDTGSPHRDTVGIKGAPLIHVDLRPKPGLPATVRGVQTGRGKCRWRGKWGEGHTRGRQQAFTLWGLLGVTSTDLSIKGGAARPKSLLCFRFPVGTVKTSSSGLGSCCCQLPLRDFRGITVTL